MPELLLAAAVFAFSRGLSTALKPRPPKPGYWDNERTGYFAGEGTL